MRIATGEVPPTARHSPARLFTSVIGVSGPALAGPTTVASNRNSASISRRIGLSSLGSTRTSPGALSTEPSYPAGREHEAGAPQDAVPHPDPLEAAQPLAVDPAERPHRRELEHVDGGRERPLRQRGRPPPPDRTPASPPDPPHP